MSTHDQHPEAQHDALTAAGCDEVFIDKASGKLASRPELDKALLSANRAGDQLVITKLDRLGRSLEHLITLSKHPTILAGYISRTDEGVASAYASRYLDGSGRPIPGDVHEVEPMDQPQIDPDYHLFPAVFYDVNGLGSCAP